jgi:hypothetical protein
VAIGLFMQMEVAFGNMDNRLLLFTNYHFLYYTPNEMKKGNPYSSRLLSHCVIVLFNE